MKQSEGVLKTEKQPEREAAELRSCGTVSSKDLVLILVRECYPYCLMADWLPGLSWADSLRRTVGTTV